MHRITFTPSALEDMFRFREYDQQVVYDKCEERLRLAPDIETRNIKRLRPNRTAEWELRIGNYRIFYDVDPHARVVEVRLVALKQGSVLLVRGKEFPL